MKTVLVVASGIFLTACTAEYQATVTAGAEQAATIADS